MPKYFTKTKHCGCIVTVTSIGIKKENNKVFHLICGHKHIKICEKCEQDKINGVDILYDMWEDEITDGYGNDGWIECSYYIYKNECFK